MSEARFGERQKAVLVEGPVGKTLVNLTFPMIFGILGIVAFNLVDTYFVGKLGTLELAALSFTFPVILVINSLAMGLGIGASAVVSRAVGEGDKFKVRCLTLHSLILSVLLVAFFVSLGLLTIEPVFRLLGASPQILPLIKQYMIIWYPGVIFVVVPMVGNSNIRALGDTKTPSLIMLVAALFNVVLDPLLIFGIGPFPRWGMKGAAIATVIARAVTLVVALYVLIHRDKILAFVRTPMKTVIQSWRQILFIGLPAAGTRIVLPLSIGVITRLVSGYGSEAVAAYGVASRIEFFALAVVAALSSVIGPFVGQNLGAGRVDRVLKGLKLSNQFSIAWGAFMFILLALAARPLSSLFNDNPLVISNIGLYLRVVPLAYGLQGVIQVNTQALNVLNKPFHAAGLILAQRVVLYFPLAYLGDRLVGLAGIFAALAVVYCAGGVGSQFTLERIIKGLRLPSPKIASAS